MVLASLNEGMVEQGNRLVYTGYVTVETTKEIMDSLEMSNQNPFSITPMMKEDVIWIKPNHVCIVEYMLNSNQSLRQSVFKGLRNDVAVVEVQI